MNADHILDPTDRRLLGLLQNNARSSMTALGKALNLSRTAVQARIGRLERDGVITSYTTVLRPSGQTSLCALISLRIGIRPCASVLKPLLSWPEIVHGYSTAGSTDAVLVVRVDAAQTLSALTDRLAVIPGVEGVETTVVLDTFIDRSGQVGTGV
ncbi:Lrp/AsnC family transcriptional regulator [Sphingomonas sp. So64.6b]|uniref:Lrp/AsnC family transcriptional regulator n=1 Tax=Sphingomonas sp. So64.6b TaxID=2997354 RepID=UPI001601CB60|nr:Lrp/AsnC family transcriptional regulator [Sphingomonas sp. So64.6b]QNA86361.1 Lrp/AsnC family transcriptional regulator [Sphingomonas sp. So64.6b]